MSTYRYPGVKPFETSDRHIFFGRDKDIADLYDLILLEKLVVLFGKSGYGKSSLLNAGVVPKFREADPDQGATYLPIIIRFGLYVDEKSIAPLEQVRRRLQEEVTTNPEGAFLTEGDSLWYQFKKRSPVLPPLGGGLGRGTSTEGASERGFILVFDQFEEFFSYPKEQQTQFKEELAELLYKNLPQSIREQLDTLPAGQQNYLLRKLDAKAVFAIRSDRMSDLDSLKDRLSAILYKRYELKGLTPDQARQAITAPAALPNTENETFLSPTFVYSQEALDKIIQELTASTVKKMDSGHSLPLGEGQGGAEAFQLQILCQYIENEVINGRIRDRNGDKKPDVHADDLPDIANVYEAYYRSQLDRLAPSEREAARELIEYGLLYEDPQKGEARRLSVDADLLVQQFATQGATQNLLKKLENTFLLRREMNTLGGYNYELSHDTLIAPVLKAKAEREAEKERQAAERRAQEAEAKAREEAQRAAELQTLKDQAEKNALEAGDARKVAEKSAQEATENARRARRVAIVAVLLMILALIAGVAAFFANREANRQRQEAVNQKLEADKATQRAEAQKLLADSSALVAQQKSEEAEKAYQQAATNLSLAQKREAEAKAALLQVEKEKDATEAQRKIAEANLIKAQEATKAAEKAQQEAIDARNRAQAGFEELQRVAAQTVTLLLREADQNILQLNYAAARDKCQAAITLLGQVPEVMKRIQEIAFFYQETGQENEVRNTRALLGRGDRFGSLQEFNPIYYDTLLRRYYPDMVTVEGGTFNMGSEQSGDGDKKPYIVTLSTYQMARTETTVWQYNLFAVTTGRELIAPGWGLWGNNPIVNVSWYDAIAYANWLSERKGLQAVYSGDLTNKNVQPNWQATGYRLPTEAEWEFAARGGNLEKDKNYKYAGGNEMVELGWFTENSQSRTQPVAQKKPNALGLYDLSGNVWEWCWDWYGSYPAAPAQNPRGAETGEVRVVRGGSWYYDDNSCRVSYRDRSVPIDGNNNFGFRLAGR